LVTLMDFAAYVAEEAAIITAVTSSMVFLII
jgi:hypothetical protein